MLLDRPLDDIFGQSSKVKILRFLVQIQAQLNGREIAKNVGLSHVKVHTALKDLTRHGIVNMRSSGNSLVYWLNEDHFLVKEIIRPAFEQENGVFEHIARIIVRAAKSARLLSVILFGSFAKGGASADSDIDMAIVYSTAKNKPLVLQELSEAEKEITGLFGNHLAGVLLGIDEFQKKFKKGDHFVKEIVRTGKVIYGKSAAELITINGKKD
ncbi:MAG: nucleotidyltransferase domain-containing protein [Candidatus Omnitrophica bacterium]|nr:nucleotidyltransferase domain-containing protein [Candidatus Omnitrophota bacterium]